MVESRVLESPAQQSQVGKGYSGKGPKPCSDQPKGPDPLEELQIQLIKSQAVQAKNKKEADANQAKIAALKRGTAEVQQLVSGADKLDSLKGDQLELQTYAKNKKKSAEGKIDKGNKTKIDEIVKWYSEEITKAQKDLVDNKTQLISLHDAVTAAQVALDAAQEVYQEKKDDFKKATTKIQNWKTLRSSIDGLESKGKIAGMYVSVVVLDELVQVLIVTSTKYKEDLNKAWTDLSTKQEEIINSTLAWEQAQIDYDAAQKTLKTLEDDRMQLFNKVDQYNPQSPGSPQSQTQS